MSSFMGIAEDGITISRLGDTFNTTGFNDLQVYYDNGNNNSNQLTAYNGFYEIPLS